MRSKQTVKSCVKDRAKVKNVAKFGASSRGYTILNRRRCDYTVLWGNRHRRRERERGGVRRRRSGFTKRLDTKSGVCELSLQLPSVSEVPLLD